MNMYGMTYPNRVVLHTANGWIPVENELHTRERWNELVDSRTQIDYIMISNTCTWSRNEHSSVQRGVFRALGRKVPHLRMSKPDSD